MADVVPLTPEQQKLAADNIRLAYWLSKKYLPPYGMDREDWEAECMVCLTRACRWYEPDKGALGTLLDRLVYLRRSNLNSYRRVKGRKTLVVSLDEERGPDGIILQDVLAAPDDDSQRQVAVRDMADRVLQSMEPRAREILVAFGNGLTHKEVAELLQVSRQRVTQIVQQARYRAARLFPAELVFNANCEICEKPIANYYEKNFARYCTDCGGSRLQSIKKEWWHKKKLEESSGE